MAKLSGPREPAVLAALRQGPEVSAEPVDEIGSRIVVAAHDLICRQGVQRTTMDQVATEAGITRITVYRRFASKDDLVVHVVRAELRRYFEQFRADVAPGATAGERLVLGFTSSVRTMRSSPVLAGLGRDDDGAAMYAVLSDGSLHAAVHAFVVAQLRSEQAAGAIAAGVDVDLAADVMVRLCTSLLLTPSDAVDVEDEGDLRRVAERALLPLLDLPAR
ncbi:TetR/AcrR family transcriptional regulator [Nocardioides montaniterrae]